MDSEKAKIYAEVGDEEGRNAQLKGAKSTQAHVEEAKQEQQTADKQDKNKTDRDPSECKSTTDLLDADAEQKAKQSE